MRTQAETLFIGGVLEAGQIVDWLDGSAEECSERAIVAAFGEQCWRDICAARARWRALGWQEVKGLILSGKGNHRFGND